VETRENFCTEIGDWRLETGGTFPRAKKGEREQGLKRRGMGLSGSGEGILQSNRILVGLLE
jgi:hypothetical protein